MDEVTKADFAIKHGKNTTDRMVPELLKAIIATLEKHGVEYGGSVKRVKQLGKDFGTEQDGWRLMFDVVNPDETFDHVEFTVKKTGWGRSL